MLKPIPPYSVSWATTSQASGAKVSAELLFGLGGILTLRSLAEDTLEFSVLAQPGVSIPGDGDWVTLWDATNRRLFTGVAKRTYTFPQGIYQYTCSNVYLGMQQTTLLGDTGRPYRIYDQQPLRDVVLNILYRAQTAGLPVQPGYMQGFQSFFDVPKQAFRAASYAAALENSLKWSAGAVTRMNYFQYPPALDVYMRSQSSPVVLDLEAETHAVTGAQLTPYPEARALGVEIIYAQRIGPTGIAYAVLTAGNPAAEASRKLSVYLSGSERTDMIASEALVTAQDATAASLAAVQIANIAISATNAAALTAYQNALTAYQNAIAARQAVIDAHQGGAPGLPASPSPINMLSYAVANQPGLSPNLLWIDAYTITLYTTATYGSAFPIDTTATGSITGLYFTTSGYPVAGTPYTSQQLADAGATSTPGYLSGYVMANKKFGSNYGHNALVSGWPNKSYTNQAQVDAAYQSWVWAVINLPINFLSKTPSQIRQALINKYQSELPPIPPEPTAPPAPGPPIQTGSVSTNIISRAEYNEAPPDLAYNYFQSQDWTPYKGTIQLHPEAVAFPSPGDFVSIRGRNAPAEWSTMAAPVSALKIDLKTGAAELTLGPSARMDYRTLVDRLRVQPEDNYKEG